MDSIEHISPQNNAIILFFNLFFLGLLNEF